MSAAPTRRLFFALWPDAAQRAALVHAAGKTVRRCGGRPVPETNLHVTLAFLGSVPEPRLEELRAIARRIAARFPREAVPLALSLEALEHWAKPQVLTVLERKAEAHAAPASGAAKLAQLLTTETAAAGFSPDLKPFRPHVTVARKVPRAPGPSAMRRVPWSFGAFALVESRTLAEWPLYSVLESYVLDGAEKVAT
ncbi:MAG TPA: RNA 2',3'-cyclic phosphodiesterase [Steroidobacteraceae bacterium]|nr:RNA 2',3'-cyclic phosphodiesterase [Steroidobacteraceae bacterium]